MRHLPIALLFLVVCVHTWGQTIAPPDKIYEELFTDVQLSRIFPDGKTFVDCVPRRDPAEILKDYRAVKNNPAVRFSLQLFVEANFIIPQPPLSDYESKGKDVVSHINTLWTVLKRKSDSAVKGSSLLPLPHPYIVPGGRFREIYYWDSYFTMLGLKESGEVETIEQMVQNFAYLINQYGHIPNGNRTYYLSRSQPPYFSLMLELLASIKGPQVYALYQPALQKEYDYWMDRTAPTKHVVKLPDGSVLDRYYDQDNQPRQESYYEDHTVSKNLPTGQRQALNRHLRSGAESGWDFSSRWFRDGHSLSTIQTTNYLPVDLNTLLHHLEHTLAKAYNETGDKLKATFYNQLADKRRKAIHKYCWSAAKGWYTDYNFVTKQQSTELTLAGMHPFFLNIGTAAQMQKASPLLRKLFLKPGGVVTTTRNTGQQWDAPNGWAPLQWATIIGLENYGQAALAKDIAARWVELNKKVYAATGKLMEKYDVVDLSKQAGGGEYPSQDGFGWTNGVLLALIKKYGFTP